MIIGLTGSIGMGKSTVSNWLKEMGIPVDDADAVVHKLYAPGGAAVEPVRQLFGDKVIDSNGGINRAALSPLVVGDANAANMKNLEAVVFPLVDAARDAFISGATKRGEHLAVLDIPLLFERGHERFCDKVAVVSAPAQMQRERVLSRANMSEAKFEGILAKQVPDATKRDKADMVFDTGLSKEATKWQVEAFMQRCKNEVAAEKEIAGRRRAMIISSAIVAGAFVLLRMRRR